MRIAMLMDKNSYSGREYLSRLKSFKIDVICIGEYKDIDPIEDERCNNLWKPEKVKILKSYFKFHFFSSLYDDELFIFLRKNKFDLGIQGGTGIIKKKIIDLFQIGIINLHPGNLPFYRGCSAPEWQLYNGDDIVSTAHFIDSSIDSGPIIDKKKLNVNMNSYYEFRASIYPESSKFLSELINKIISDKLMLFNAQIQDESKAIYRKYIGDDIILKLKNKFNGSV